MSTLPDGETMSFYNGHALTYSQSVYGQSCPAGVSSQIWRRIQQIGNDTRLPAIRIDLLPPGHSALYELTKMSSRTLQGMVSAGLMRPSLSCREIRSIRITGMVPVRITVGVGVEDVSVSGLIERVSGLPGVLSCHVDS